MRKERRSSCRLWENTSVRGLVSLRQKSWLAVPLKRLQAEIAQSWPSGEFLSFLPMKLKSPLEAERKSTLLDQASKGEI